MMKLKELQLFDGSTRKEKKQDGETKGRNKRRYGS